MSDNKVITIKDKDKVYVFRLNILLRQEDIEKIRIHLKQQIEEGCVVLPAFLELINVEEGEL